MAYGKYPRKGKKSFVKKSSKPRRAVAKSRKTNFVKAVKSVISSQVEDKFAYLSQGTSLTYFNSGIDSSGDMLQVIPNIAKGTNDNERVGDSITAKWLNIKGYVKLNTNDIIDSTRLPAVYVRMFLVSPKYRNNYSDVIGSTSPLSALLKKGGTTSGWSGLISDMYAQVNTELFTLHEERKFYLSQSFIASPGTQPGAPSALVASDTKETVKFFNMSWKCKGKKLLYDGGLGASIQPVNYSPILLIGYCYLDGSTADTLSTNLGVNYTSHLCYEDV